MLGIMHVEISNTVKEEVKKLLPALREEVRKEFVHWDLYTGTADFLSDEKVFEILPYATYEYIILSWGIEPGRVTPTSVIHAMNNKLFGDLKHIICHALRRLALRQGNQRKA
jgi:hypothetical protein